MQEKKTKILHLVYGIVLSVLIFAVGMCFIFSCIDIHNAGKFTVDTIRIHFLWILAPTLLCIALIIGGAVLHAVFPPYEEKIGVSMTDKDILKNLYKRIDMEKAPEEYKRVIKSQRGFRLTFLIVTIVNAVINAVSALIYIFTRSNLAEVDAGKLNEIFPVIFKILAYAVIPFFVAIVYDIFSKFTYEKELEAVKAIYAFYAKNGKPISLDGEEEVEEKEEFKGDGVFGYDLKNNFVKIVKYSVLCFSILFIVLGIINGLLDGTLGYVLTNAIKICFGCVGLS